jgi:hypothetical protein
MKVKWDEGGRRMLLGDNTQGGGHPAADHVPPFCGVDSIWTPLCVCTYIVEHTFTKFLFEPGLLEHNPCVKWGKCL